MSSTENDTKSKRRNVVTAGLATIMTASMVASPFAALASESQQPGEQMVVTTADGNEAAGESGEPQAAQQVAAQAPASQAVTANAGTDAGTVANAGAASNGTPASEQSVKTDGEIMPAATQNQAGATQSGTTYEALTDAQASTIEQRLVSFMSAKQNYAGMADLGVIVSDASDATVDQVKADVDKIVDKILQDHPEFWYVQPGSWIQYNLDEAADALHLDSVSPNYLYSKDDGRTADTAAIDAEQKKIDATVGEAKAWVPTDATDAQAVDALHDWYVLNVSLDMQNLASHDNAHDALVSRVANPRGYASGFAYLLSQARGLSSVMVGQYSADGGSVHTWPRVTADGRVYNVDVTWDKIRTDASSQSIADDTDLLKSDLYFQSASKGAQGGWHHVSEGGDVSWTPKTGMTASDTTYDADGDGDASTKILKNYTGAWVDQVTVHFDAGSGDATGTMPDQAVPSGVETALSANAFTRPGYVFTGWSTVPDGKGGVSYADGDKVTLEGVGTTESVTLFAQWAPATSQVLRLNVHENYVADGADAESVKTSETAIDGAFKAPDALADRDGFIFTGWNTKADGTGETVAPGSYLGSDIADRVTSEPGDNGAVTQYSEIDLYAQWASVEDVYGWVALDPDGGIGTADRIQVDPAQGKAAAPANPFTLGGSDFVEWNTKPDGTGTSYQPGDDVEAKAGEHVTLYAIWRDHDAAEKVTVTYDPNGGSGNAYEQEVVKSSDAGAFSSRFTREGYEFAGWNTKPDGTGASYQPGGAINVAEPTTLYAQWEKSEPDTPEPAKTATVTFDLNGADGEAPAAVTDDLGQGVAIPTVSRNGYELTGWNTAKDGSGESHGAGSSIVLTGDVTLYAQWKQVTPDPTPDQPDTPAGDVAITFDANGGTGTMEPQMVTSGQEAALASNLFSRDGYEFAGWNTNPYGTGAKWADGSRITLTAPITLYAQWEKAGDTPDRPDQSSKPDTPSDENVLVSLAVNGTDMKAGTKVVSVANGSVSVKVTGADGKEVRTVELDGMNATAYDLTLENGQTLTVTVTSGTPTFYIGTVTPVASGTIVKPGNAKFVGTYGDGTIQIVGSDGQVKNTYKVSGTAHDDYQSQVENVKLAEGDRIAYWSNSGYVKGGSTTRVAFNFQLVYTDGSGVNNGDSADGKTSTKSLSNSTPVFTGTVNGVKTYFLTRDAAVAAGVENPESTTLNEALKAGFTPDATTISDDGYTFSVDGKTKTTTLAATDMVWVSEGASYYHKDANCDMLKGANDQGSRMRKVTVLTAAQAGIKPCPEEFEDDGYSFDVTTTTTTDNNGTTNGGTTNGSANGGATSGNGSTTTTTTTSGGNGGTGTRATQTKTLMLEGGHRYTVGKSDLVAGTYDLAVTSGSGTLMIYVSATTDASGNVQLGEQKMALQLSRDGTNGQSSYTGLTLKDGNVLVVPSGLTITLSTQVDVSNGQNASSGTTAGTMAQLGNGAAIGLGIGAVIVLGGAGYLVYSAKKGKKDGKDGNAADKSEAKPKDAGKAADKQEDAPEKK